MTRFPSGRVLGTREPLATRYDVALLDLDGVVYLGAQPIPGAADALAAVRAAGMRLAFITNNASRNPAAVAAHLVELGVPATVDDVVTSSQAAATVIAERCGIGARVLVTGTDALRAAVEQAGLQIVASANDRPDAVVQGYSPELRYADLAMLNAKATQRNAFRVFQTSLAVVAQERISLVEELRLALTSNQLEVFYQPQVSLVDAELVGLEALVRWRHPTRGLIAPDAFIGLAEDVGLIGAIGLIVAEQAVRDVSRWQQAYGRSLTLALNVSAYQLRDSVFIEQLGEILHQHDFSAHNVELEITESALVASLDLSPGVMRALTRLGARVVLDDLGVAYSSFSYLKQFRVHGVKLDRGFVIGVPSDGTDSAIVRAIISLARSLKLRVVAEGIEYAEQRAYLIDQGCGEGQGYLFARPLPPAAIEALFAAPRHTVGQRVLFLPIR